MSRSAVAVPPTTRLVAVHEAAHAVVAHLAGLRVTQLELGAAPELAGACHTLDLLAAPGETDPLVRLDVALAGPLAEAMEAGRTEPDEHAADLDLAVRLALRLAGDCEAAHRLLLERAAAVRAALEQHWPAVDGLARALERRGRLGAAELDALLAALVRD